MKLRIVSVFFLFCSSVYAGNVYIKSDPPRVGILSFKLLKLAQDEDQDGHAFLLELDDDSGGWELPVPDNNRLVYSNITGEIEITWYVSPKGDGAYDAYKCRSTKLKVNEGDNITVTLRRGLFDYNTKILESENKPNDHAEYFDHTFPTFFCQFLAFNCSSLTRSSEISFHFAINLSKRLPSSIHFL